MYKVGENRKRIEWPQTELDHITVKRTLYTLNTYPWGPNFSPFRSTISRFRDIWCTKWAKIGNAPNDPNWTWTLNSQKYPIYTKYSPPRSTFWSVSLYDQHFPRYCTFYHSPLTTMLNVQKKKKEKKKLLNIQSLNFATLWATSVETLPSSMHDFLGVNLMRN